MRGERGITVTELIVGLAIAALIVGILATVIYQIFDITGWGNSMLVVQHDLRNAATWLNRDVLTASRAEVSSSQMVLYVPYYSPAVADFLTRTITYTLSGDELLREDHGGSSLVLARYVDPSRFSFSPTGTVLAPSTITVTLASKKGDVPGSGTFALKMRPGGSIPVAHLCQVTGAENLEFYGGTVTWTITNTGDTSPSIDEIYITWPITNTGLNGVWLDTSPIWDGLENPPSTTIDGPWLLENRELTSGTQKTLKFTFEATNVVNDEGLYSIAITLTDNCTFSFPPNP